MVDQIASLGVAIDSSSARKATDDLRQFTQTAGASEEAYRAIGRAQADVIAVTRRAHNENVRNREAVRAKTEADKRATDALRGRTAAENEATGAAARATAQLEQTNRTVDHLGVRTESSARSYGAMVAAIMRGDLQQANASLATLASRMAVIPALTTPAGAAVAALTVGIGAVAAIATVAAFELDRFNRMIVATGQRSGESAGSMVSLRNEVGRLTNDYKGATEAVTELVRWGRVSGQEFDTVARAAAIWGRNTGRATSEVVQQLTALGDGGTDALLALNDAYGFLTPATFRYIEAVRQQDGDMAAMRETMIHVDAATIALMETTEDARGTIVRSWEAITGAVRGYARAVLDLGRTDDDYLVEQAEKRVKLGERLIRDAENRGASARSLARLQESLAAAEADLAADREARDRNELAREEEAARRQTQAAAVRAQAEIEANVARINEEERFGRDVARVRERYLALWKAQDFAGLSELEVRATVDPETLRVDFTGGTYDAEIAALEKARESRTKLTDAEREAQRTSREQETTYARLSRQAAAYASELDLTADSGDNLSKVERFIKVTRDQMAAGTVNLTGVMREQLNVALDELEVSERRRKESIAKNESIAREAELTARLAESMETAVAAAEREVAAVGMSRRERELSNQIDRIANEALRERRRLIKELGGEEAQYHADYQARMQQIAQWEQDRIDLARRSADRRSEAEGDWRNGVRRAMLDIRDETTNHAKMAETVVTDSYNAMTDALTHFARTGELRIKDMTVSILESMMQMAMQIAASQILMSIMGQFMPSPSYTPVAQGGSASYGSWTSGGYAARGNVYEGGRHATHFARGGIFDRATNFPMAGGRTGRLGEEGAEAIMPLGRDSSGRLGVRMVGGEPGGGVVVNAVTNVTINSDGSATATTTTDDAQTGGRQLGVMLTERVKGIMIEQSRPGGILWNMRNGR